MALRAEYYGEELATGTHGRTLLELTEQPDGHWIATQHDVEVTGTGETAALAAMDYCRRIARGEHESGAASTAS